VFEDGVDHVVDCLHVEGHALLWLEVGEVGGRRRRVAVFIERARSEDSSSSGRIHVACAPPSSARRSQSGIHVLDRSLCPFQLACRARERRVNLHCAASEMSKLTLPRYTSRCFGRGDYRHRLPSFVRCKSNRKRLERGEENGCDLIRVDLISSRCRKTRLAPARSTAGRLEDDHPNCKEAPERSRSQLARLCRTLARRSVHSNSPHRRNTTQPVTEDAAPIVCHQQATDKTSGRDHRAPRGCQVGRGRTGPRPQDPE
jgi:hypothetical protein